VQHAGRKARKARQRVAVHPHPRIRVARERHLRGVAPDRFHVVGRRVVAARRIQEGFGHLHRISGADQRNPLRMFGVSRGKFQCNQRTHRMTNEIYFFNF